MKRSLLALVLALAAGAAFADDLRDNVGIGLGTMIFKGQDGLFSQTCAATTNGIFGNQTFAITSGTSEAKPYKGIAQNEALQRFVADNMDSLAREIAMGRGEHLDTMAELLAVPAEKRDGFRRTLQANFGKIYGSDAVTHLEVLRAVSALAEA